jgi:hypothetical protein
MNCLANVRFVCLFLEWGEGYQLGQVLLAQYDNAVSCIFIETCVCDVLCQGFSPAVLITL